MRTTLLNGNSLFRQTAGGLKFTSVLGELTDYEVAVSGSTGGQRTIYLIDLCQLYHGYDQTDQLKKHGLIYRAKTYYTRRNQDGRKYVYFGGYYQNC